MPRDYLRKILTARVYDVANETQLDAAPGISQRIGNRVLLKREDLQPVFSFKLRGAYNKMAHCTPEQLERGVIAASAGNHAQGVALGAARLGCKAVIVMPTTTPQVKVDAVRAHGGKSVQIVLHGTSYSDAALHASELEKQHGYTFIHPFDDPYVIAGQGTVAMEILRQHQAPIHAVFVAIGGGGLISGVAAYIKQVRPDIKVIGVQTVDSDAMTRSVKAGKRVTLADVGLFSDGTAVKLVGKETFRLCRELVDDYVLCDTDEVCAAIKDVFMDTRSVVEPAGALALAGLKKYAKAHGLKDETLVAIACGANMNFARLRFVAERTEIGEAREALFAVSIPEERGSFKRFCELVGTRSVTEFNYRISDEKTAHVFVGMSTANAGENEKIAANFAKHGYATVDLSHDEMAADHIRHMVGGKSALAAGELIYSFVFPERPGALMNFLTSMAPGWNISMFHYRNQGADYSRVLVGLQVPKGERKAFKAFLAGLGYPYSDETENPAYRLFLG
ncbi:threonine ammonia-lyase, biosynthetic [Derxia gummosa]|uniref:L-threonine dehydratase n=1 Tax=Derxia gummosa DSM 723 TaxID=1121388 RepID=A0A8B6X290_9BURK|nr:threonine ammonia-lyase, biosynthetic [Derxia gummosa]